MDMSSGIGKNMKDSMISQRKSLTPAVLGVPYVSHGAKLSSTMNSKDKEELLLKLEAWRQARKEKLTITILAKGKTSNNSKLPTTLPKPRVRKMSKSEMGTDAKENQNDGKKSVFDRLYENASKAAAKKEEENKKVLAKRKNPQPVKLRKYPPFGKPKVPIVIRMTDVDDSNSQQEETQKNTTLSVPVVENVSEDIVVIDNESDNCVFINETPNDTDLSIIEEEIASEDKVEVDNESDVCVFTNEMPKGTDLSIIEEEIASELQDEVNDGLGTSTEETPKESPLSVVDEHNVSENVKEVDELKQEEDFDKRNICFETPKEKPLSAVNLRNELEDWPTENDHSIDIYKNWRDSGLKTPIQHLQARMNDLSYSFYSTAPNTPTVMDESDKENVTPPVTAPKVDVEGWLRDLHRLILDAEYPTDRCEEWLNAIRKKFPNCTQLPIYWECFAIINDDADGLKSIEKTDESEKVDDHETSIADLFDKLVIDEKCRSASKTERGLSMKNILKSKTVKFAIEEKAVKELDPESGTEARRKVLVATPVRRSARLQTPEKFKVIGSLESLDPETRGSVSFQPNKALLTG